jgi:hypothetical protein
MTIAWVVLAIGIGLLFGLAIGVMLRRATAKAPPTNGVGISCIGCDMSGNGYAEINPQYARMVSEVLKQPATESGFRTLLP